LWLLLIAIHLDQGLAGAEVVFDVGAVSNCSSDNLRTQLGSRITFDGAGGSFGQPPVSTPPSGNARTTKKAPGLRRRLVCHPG
jgi:hypothetical protein